MKKLASLLTINGLVPTYAKWWHPGRAAPPLADATAPVNSDPETYPNPNLPHLEFRPMCM